MVSARLKLLKTLKRELKLETKIRTREELEYKEDTIPYLYSELDAQRKKTKQFINQLAGL